MLVVMVEGGSHIAARAPTTCHVFLPTMQLLQPLLLCPLNVQLPKVLAARAQ